MKTRPSPQKVFLIASLLSGLGSGLSVVVQPLGIVVPGVFFGLALAYASNRTIRPLTVEQTLALVTGSTIAFVLAIVASLLARRIAGAGNGFEASAFIGATAGAVGALLVALTLAAVIEDFRVAVSIVLISFIGGLGGTLFAVIAVYISDHTAAGHPYDDIVAFPIWQVAVAATVAFLHTKSLPRYNTDPDG